MAGNVISLYPAYADFGECGSCGKHINVGDWYYTIYWSRELVINQNEVQPAESTMTHIFCESCAKKIDFSSITVGAKTI